MIVPTLSELYESVKADLKNKLGITSPLTKLVLLAFAAVQAAKLKIYYLAVAQINKNIFVDTCDNDTIERFGFVKLGRYPYAAIEGEYYINVAGSIGATIPPGTTYKSMDTSTSPDKLFILDTLFTFTSTTGLILVRSTEAGVDALLNITDELQLTSPLALVDSFATVDSIAVTPVEAEDIEEYRINVIEAYRTEPQGGARVDYMLWAQDAEGIRRVYPYVKSGSPGDINIYIEAFIADSPTLDGVPSASQIIDVESVINNDPATTLGRRPMGVFNIFYLAVIPLDVDIKITGLTPSVSLTAIESAVTTFLYNIRPFIDGGDAINTKNDKLYEADIYRIVRDILTGNETFTSIELSVNGTPTNLYTFENGTIPFLNSVTSV